MIRKATEKDMELLVQLRVDFLMDQNPEKTLESKNQLIENLYSYFEKATHKVELDPSTIDANARFFEKREDVPTQALSMGVGQIMNANKILLIALGKGKADILEKSLFGDVTPEVPASILQFFKGEVVVCADEEALSVILEKHPEAVTK